MRVLIDIVHPAHVHFYRNLIGDLTSGGHSVSIVARDKDVTLELLSASGLDHITVGAAGDNSLLALGSELVRRVVTLRRVGRDVGADLILTRNPAGVQAARLLRIPGVFDTDDGAVVGIHWKAAAPFATHITMPDVVDADFRGKRVAYPSYKAMAFLHPDRFTPDRSVLGELGVGEGEPYAIVRFVAMKASHDRAEAGIPGQVKEEVIRRLARTGRVFVTSESGSVVPPDAEPLPVPAHRFHDALAFARLMVGDSQSVAAEAAILGVPSVRLSSWTGRIPYLVELERRYGLVFEFPLGDEAQFLTKVDEVAAADPGGWADRRRALLADKCDLTTWYRDFVLSLR